MNKKQLDFLFSDLMLEEWRERTQMYPYKALYSKDTWLDNHLLIEVR